MAAGTSAAPITPALDTLIAGGMLRDMSHDVAAPGADDPDTPTEAVGSLPTIDFGRLGLPPLGWVFVAVALFVAATRLRTIGGAPADIAPDILLSSIQATVVVLLPAALLWRAPAAIRTHTLLLTGLALVAAAQVVFAANQLWPLFHSDDGTRSTFDAAWPLLTPAGGLLIGLGLLRLRVGAHRLSVLAAIVVTYVGIGVASYLIGAGTGTLDAYDAALMVIVPAAAAVAVWVPVAAWLESDTPQAFWGLLAVALPVGVISRLLTLLATIVGTSTQSNVLFVPMITINAFLGSVAVLLALVAYVRMTPIGTPAAAPAD